MTNTVDGVDLGKLSAFEVSFQMQKIARDNKDHLSYLNAGRGNPNWINVETRLAFARLMEWGCLESRRTYSQGAMAGYTLEQGMGERFDAFLASRDDAISAFLAQAIRWCCDHEAMDKEDLLKELCDAVVGNTYPSPSRCLTHVERILNSYLQSALYHGADLKDSTDVFACEGGTAAMCYAFDSLRHNGLLHPDDKIALNTPIFTPYLEIPKLEDFQLVEIDLSAKEDRGWEIDVDQFDKLLDPQIKVFFLVNPSNPGSKALSKAALDRLEQVCQARPDLMIITDDVYGTFVDGFQTVYARLPYNTLLVYSFSKLYGVTGWRLGLIALNKDNVFDHLISQLDRSVKEGLANDYSIVTTDVDSFPFIDRLCADSRNIALYHTAGLSCPQQTMMALMSLSHLVQGEKDGYIGLTKEILDHRYRTLYQTLGVPFDHSADNAEYYTLVDMYQLAAEKHSSAFSQWLRSSFNQADFMIDLAREDGVVLVEGIGFDATPGTLRVSFANLVDTDYEAIAKRILEVLDRYYRQYQNSKEGKLPSEGVRPDGSQPGGVQ